MPGCHVQPEQMFNLIWGYNATYEERLDTTTTSAGDNRWSGTVVPTDEVWVITTIQGWNVTTTAGVLHCGKWNGTVQNIVKDTRYYTPTRIIDWQGMLVLSAGWYPYIMWGSCVANDRRIGHMTGYKMKLTQ